MATKSIAPAKVRRSVEHGVPVAADNIYPYQVGIIGGLVAGAVMALSMALWGRSLEGGFGSL